jgi:hypothetical protein
MLAIILVAFASDSVIFPSATSCGFSGISTSSDSFIGISVNLTLLSGIGLAVTRIFPERQSKTNQPLNVFVVIPYAPYLFASHIYMLEILHATD